MTLITRTANDLGLKSGTSSRKAWRSCQKSEVLVRDTAQVFHKPAGAGWEAFLSGACQETPGLGSPR